MKIRETRRGARLSHGRHVISEVLRDPGPTHSVFDVLAAGVSILSGSDASVAMLGFAGGGMIAPLRALGAQQRIYAVDLSLEGAEVFRRLCAAWAGEVKVDRSDAVAWLTRQRVLFDAIVEDLSVEVQGDVQKPAVSMETLPALIAQRLQPHGVCLINALPVPGLSWRDEILLLTEAYAEVRVVHFRDYENRIVIGASQLATARELGRELSAALQRMRSRLVGKVRVESFRSQKGYETVGAAGAAS
jgi:spermidine synthase